MDYHYSGHGARDEAKVALTFDDGPNPHATPKILDILKEKGAQGTFFCLAEQAALYPEIMARIVEEGHLVGNHTVRHTEGDFEQAEATMSRVLKGADISSIRAPFLDWSYYAGLPADYLDKKKVVHFDVDSYDWQPGVTARQIISRVMLLVRSGSIIDFHDGSEDPAQRLDRAMPLIEALPELIDLLQEKFKLVTTDDLKLVSELKKSGDLSKENVPLYPPVTQKILLRSKGEILTLQHDSGIVEFPGGKIEWGEGLLDAINRELSEEIGTTIQNMPRLLHIWNYISRDRTRHSVMVYYLYDLDQKPNLSSDEGHRFLWLDYEKMREIGMISDPDFLKKMFL